MKAFDYSLVKDPQYFCDNRMEAHSDHVYYRDGNEMQTAVQDGTETSFRYSLNGLWKFHYARNYKSAVQGFEKEDYCCYDWEDIHVPAHIQMEGYDAPQYANVQYPWEGHEEIYPGQIPERFNPVASYVKYFTVPEHMKGKRLFISFQGAESGLALWLNGAFIGYSEDSFTPSEFELTDYLKDGQNKLAAQVFKWTSSSWCEDQDFFRFSGIYRDVYLYTVPDTHAYDLQIRAIPEENLDVADLEIKVKTWGKGSIVFRLEKDGECVLEEKKSLTEAGNEEADAETLYTLVATIKNDAGESVTVSFAHRLPEGAPSDMCVAEVVEKAFALEAGASMKGTQVLRGEITSIPTAYSADYKNITVNIKVGDKEIMCYRLAGGEELKVGDVITVTGTIKNYNGTIEFDKGCTYVK